MKRDLARDAEGWITEYDGVPVIRFSQIPKLSKTEAKRAPLKYAINIKGCNGSGKSTVLIAMIEEEKDRMKYVVCSPEDKKPVATYLPEWDTVIIGTYLTACGGCDSLGNTDVVKFVLSRLWKTDSHILFEGVIVGDIKSTFYELMKAFREVHQRRISFCFMGTKLSECLARIQKRNGGKPINEELVRQKYKNSVTHLQYYIGQADVGVQVLNTEGTKREVMNRFTALYPELGLPF